VRAEENSSAFFIIFAIGSLTISPLAAVGTPVVRYKKQIMNMNRKKTIKWILIAIAISIFPALWITAYVKFNSQEAKEWQEHVRFGIV
jgi:hypothetical protein